MNLHELPKCVRVDVIAKWCSPPLYAFVLGHVGRFQGRNVIDATHVRHATKPDEAFHHTLDVLTQHLYNCVMSNFRICVRCGCATDM